MENYVTVQGDAWDMIAKTAYGDERKLDYLMEHNPELLDIAVFPAGVIVKTPALPSDSSTGWPEWRK